MIRIKCKRGYIYLYKPDHPRTNRMNLILEHRFVMEEHLGRPLIKKETIHHLNQIKDDNRIENLKLFPNNSAHKKWEWKHGVYEGVSTKRGLYDDEYREKLVEEIRQGASYESLSRKYGPCTVTIKIWCQARGVKAKGSVTDEETKTRIREMLEEGLTYRKIAELIGVSHATVCGISAKRSNYVKYARQRNIEAK